MEAFPRMVTVDQAAALLGVSRRGVIELIGNGTLTWTMAADKHTVIVEMPSDPAKCLGEIGGPVKSPGAPKGQPPTGKPEPREKTVRAGSESPTISDLDAWSQPK